MAVECVVVPLWVIAGILLFGMLLGWGPND